jgi:uncharacterized Zn finger protein
MARYDEFPPYVSVADRRAMAQREATKRKKKGQTLTPIAIDGRKIATTFWGKAWCDHLESHSDYANRLPRGRAYVRNGSVIDLQIAKGRVTALVQGTELYEVTVTIAPLIKARWTKIVAACTGKIDSLVELLQGNLSRGVMEVVTHRIDGLFPAPAQIDMECSCPDFATMCKHVAAALYGVGARLDEKPELLFTLREVDHLSLIESVGTLSPRRPRVGGGRVIAQKDVASVFGIEIDAPHATRELRPMGSRTAGTNAAERRKKRR